MSNKIILVGGFHEVIELCEICQKTVVGIIDNRLTGRYLGCDVLGGDDIAPNLYQEFKEVPIFIAPDIPHVRSRLASYYSSIGYQFGNLISPKATISSSAKMGSGVMIQNGVNISSMVRIGNFVRINSCSNIMHDAVIDDFVTIAPNAVILGNVKINEGAYVGANATVLSGLTIGENAVVGAGAVVTRDTEKGVTVAGNPAKPLLK